MTKSGFKKLVETVIKNTSKKAGKEEYSIAAGMESTGVYGERLAYYLNGNSHNGRIVTYVLNPAAVRAFGNSVMAPNKKRLRRCPAYSLIPLHGSNKGTDISMEGTLTRRPCS
jgi:transposase